MDKTFRIGFSVFLFIFDVNSEFESVIALDGAFVDDIAESELSFALESFK